MSLTQRIPELEATLEPREGHVTVSEGADKGNPRSSRSPHSAARGYTGFSSGRSRRERPSGPGT
jgi:hypothetical protein